MNSKELAKIVGVSQSTVSRALNDSALVSEETKRLIKGIAAANDFALNSSARSLKTKKTRTIGIVFEEHFVDFNLHIYQSHMFNLIRKELQKSDYDVMILFENMFSSSRLGQILEVVRNRKVDGLIVMHTNIDEIEKEVEACSLPYVQILSTSSHKHMKNTIVIDYSTGGYKVGKYFALAGHKNIAVISDSNPTTISKVDKLKGFLKACNENGINVPEERIVFGDLRFKSGYNAVMDNLSMFKEVTALFAINDTMALGAIEAFRELGIKVPDNIEVIGFDNIPMCEWFKPYLSTIAIDNENMVADAWTWLEKQIDNDKEYIHQHRVLDTKLILRGTCAVNKANLKEIDEIVL